MIKKEVLLNVLWLQVSASALWVLLAAFKLILSSGYSERITPTLMLPEFYATIVAVWLLCASSFRFFHDLNTDRFLFQFQVGAFVTTTVLLACSTRSATFGVLIVLASFVSLLATWMDSTLVVKD